jgi:DNA invertase Pin-like site-specific DNA recombinase
VTHQFADRGVSGTCARRPGRDRLLASARQGDIDLILVTGLHRLGYDIAGLIELVEHLGTLCVGLVTADDPGIDTTLPTTAYDVMAALGQMQRDQVAATTSLAHERRRLAGPPSAGLDPTKGLSAALATLRGGQTLKVALQQMKARH